MKKLIGIVITLLSAVATMAVWSILGLAFELEGMTRDRLGNGVNAAALIPLAVYLGCVIYTHCVYKKRLDANHYQPLYRRPVGLVVNAAAQAAALALLGFPTQSVGQTAAAFATAMTLVVVTGLLTLGAALIFGRPIGGRTCLPFARHHQYQ